MTKTKLEVLLRKIRQNPETLVDPKCGAFLSVEDQYTPAFKAKTEEFKFALKPDCRLIMTPLMRMALEQLDTLSVVHQMRDNGDKPSTYRSLVILTFKRPNMTVPACRIAVVTDWQQYRTGLVEVNTPKMSGHVWHSMICCQYDPSWITAVRSVSKGFGFRFEVSLNGGTSPLLREAGLGMHFLRLTAEAASRRIDQPRQEFTIDAWSEKYDHEKDESSTVSHDIGTFWGA